MTLEDVIPANVLREEPVSEDVIDGYMNAIRAGDAEAQKSDPPWLPSDTNDAEFCMARLAAITHELHEIADQAMQWHQSIKQWQVREEDRRVLRAAYYEQRLVEYAARWRAEDPKHRRTLYLPSGEVAITVPKTAVVEISDPSALLPWLQDHPQGDLAIKPPSAPEVMVSGLRRIAKGARDDHEPTGWIAVDKETGRPVPGAIAHPPGDPRYNVKPHVPPKET